MAVNVNVDFRETSVNTGDNFSNVYLKIAIVTTGESYNNTTQNGTINFGGATTISYKLPRNSTTVVYEQTKRIYHNNNGDGSASYSYSLPTTPSGGTRTGSDSITLTHIARYFNSIAITKITPAETSAQVNWSVSPNNANALLYSLNNGSTWLDVWGNPFTIPNLTQDTAYNVKIKARRADSNLWSETGNTSFRTNKAIATFVKHQFSSKTINSIDILYRPNRAITQVQYKINNGSWNNTTTISGTWNSPNNDVIYRISNLNPNTEYKIKTRIQCANANWTESSEISVTTYDYAKITSAFAFNIGQNPTITFTNPSGIQVKVKAENIQNDKVESVLVSETNASSPTQHTFSFDANTLYSKVPTSQNGLIRYTISQYCGGETYRHIVHAIYRVTNSNPIFTNFNYRDISAKTTALTGNNQTIIKRYSSVVVTIPVADKMIAQNYAIPSYYVINNVHLGYRANSDINYVINNYNNNDVRVTAYDSRGLNKTVIKQLSTIDFVECKINSLSIQRKNGIGNTLLISLRATYQDINFGAVNNTIDTIQLRYKKTNEQAYSSWVSIKNLFTIADGSVTGTNRELVTPTFELDHYNIQVQIADKLSSHIVQYDIDNGKPLMSAVVGKGVAFGKIYDSSQGGVVQIGGDLKGQGNIDISGQYNGYTLASACSKDTYTRSSLGDIGWVSQTDGDAKVISKSALAYWNGRHSGSSSNLQYCDRGRFGTIVTKNTDDYASSAVATTSANGLMSSSDKTKLDSMNNNYSTSPVQIGLWQNNKTLYKIGISGTFPNDKNFIQTGVPASAVIFVKGTAEGRPFTYWGSEETTNNVAVDVIAYYGTLRYRLQNSLLFGKDFSMEIEFIN